MQVTSRARTDRQQTQRAAAGGRGGRRRGGFTLLELLVVVMIIMVLVSIGVALGPAMAGRGSEQMTRTVLSTAESVLTEYRVVTGTWPDVTSETYTTNRVGLEMDTGDPGDYLYIEDDQDFIDHSSERFVARTLQTTIIARDDLRVKLRERSSINSLYEELGSDVFADTDETGEDGFGFMELRDGWGEKILYVPALQDHPQWWHNEVTWFLPARQSPYFVSAGPDGEFGNVYADQDTPEYEQSLDNIYSYDVVNP